MFTTLDGHNFKRFKDYVVWNNVLKFVQTFEDRKLMVGLGQDQYTINNLSECNIMKRYLYTYLNFPYIEIMKIKPNTTICIDVTDKVLEVKNVVE